MLCVQYLWMFRGGGGTLATTGSKGLHQFPEVPNPVSSSVVLATDTVSTLGSCHALKPLEGLLPAINVTAFIHKIDEVEALSQIRSSKISSSFFMHLLFPCDPFSPSPQDIVGSSDYMWTCLNNAFSVACAICKQGPQIMIVNKEQTWSLNRKV